MNAKDAIDIFFTSRQNIQSFWNFYALVVVALLGWLVSLDDNLGWQLKLLVSTSFMSFVALNAIALLRSYDLVVSSQEDIKDLLARGEKDHQHVASLILRMKFRSKPVWALHAVVDTVLLVALWSDKIWVSLRGTTC